MKYLYLALIIFCALPAFAQPSEIPNQCASCAPVTRLISYDFANNSICSTWPKRSRLLHKRFWAGLPWAGREFTFQVLHVNPFRFDITIADERFDFNTDFPGDLQTLTVDLAKIAAAPTTEKVKKKETLADAVEQLGIDVAFYISEFQNASDCFDPCEAVQEINSKFVTKFRSLGYRGTVPLEKFLYDTLDLSRDPADAADKKLIGKHTTILAAYSKFRKTGRGTVNYLIPQVQNVDQYVFKLNIAPKEGITTGNRVLNQEIAVNVRGGFKADVSTGLLLSTLVDSRYTLRNDSTLLSVKKKNGADSSGNFRKQIVEDRIGKYSFGLATLFHIYYRFPPSVCIGASIGAGVTLSDKPKMQYLIGPSIMIGKANRLVATWGISMGYVEWLSDRYDQSNPNAIYVPVKETGIDMKRVFTTKHFLSLTYNLPMGKKTKVVSIGSGGSDAKKKEDPKEDK